MLSFKQLNENTSLTDQMQVNEDGSIVLINVFTIDDASEEEALIEAWAHDAEYMQQQPGYISTQMHKGVGGSLTYLNYAVWENVESFKNAFSNPEFHKRISEYPKSAVAAPHLFKKIAVKGFCVS